MFTLGISWGGGSAAPMPASCRLPSSRLSVAGDPFISAVRFIIRTADRNKQVFAIPSAWPKPGSSRQSAASETAMATPWSNASMVFARLRSSTDAGLGGPSKQSISSPSNRSTGSITGACLNPSATSHRPKPGPTSTPHWNNRPWPHTSNQTAFGIPGTVQIADVAR